MPARLPAHFAALLVGAISLCGCAATGGGMEAALQPASMTFAGQADAVLPETVSVLPGSFNGASPSQEAPPADAFAAASLAAETSGDAAAMPPPVPQAAPWGETEAEAEAETKPLIVAAAAELVVKPLASLLPRSEPSHGDVDALISKYAEMYEVPETLVRRVVKRESNFNPSAYSRGHWGLMQIKHATARGMGYRGSANGLLDADTNLKYAVKYLRGAYMVAGGNHDRADRLYQRGYYYDAKRMGLLDETGLGRDRARRRA